MYNIYIYTHNIIYNNKQYILGGQLLYCIFVRPLNESLVWGGREREIMFKWPKSCLAATFIWYITSKYQMYSNKKCWKPVL